MTLPAMTSDLKTQPSVYTSTKRRFRSDPVIVAKAIHIFVWINHFQKILSLPCGTIHTHLPWQLRSYMSPTVCRMQYSLSFPVSEHDIAMERERKELTTTEFLH